MVIVKILVFIWPFVREMIFGDKKFSRILVENKKTFLVVVLLFVSLTINLLVVPKLFAITKEYLILSKTVKSHVECQTSLAAPLGILSTPVMSNIPSEPNQKSLPVRKDALRTETNVRYPKKDDHKHKDTGSDDSKHKRTVDTDTAHNAALDDVKKDLLSIRQKESKELQNREWKVD